MSLHVHFVGRSQEVSIGNGKFSIEQLRKTTELFSVTNCPIREVTFLTVLPNNRVFLQAHHRQDESGRPLKSSRLRKYYFDAEPEQVRKFLEVFNSQSHLRIDLPRAA